MATGVATKCEPHPAATGDASPSPDDDTDSRALDGLVAAVQFARETGPSDAVGVMVLGVRNFQLLVGYRIAFNLIGDVSSACPLRMLQ